MVDRSEVGAQDAQEQVRLLRLSLSSFQPYLSPPSPGSPHLPLELLRHVGCCHLLIRALE